MTSVLQTGNKLLRHGYCSLISERERHSADLQYKVALSGTGLYIFHYYFPFEELPFQEQNRWVVTYNRAYKETMIRALKYADD